MRSILVDRASLGLPELQLWQAGKFILPEGTFGPGNTDHRRLTTDSPIVKGRYPSSIVEDSRVGNLAVHVMADDINSLQPRVEEVITALTQFQYMLVWQWNGLSGTWRCEAADLAVGEAGIINEGWLRVHNQPLYFTIPHTRISGL